MGLWGSKKDGTVLRFLSERKVKKIKQGKDVYIKVSGIVVCLTQKGHTTRIEARISKLREKIKKLEQQKEGQ